MAETKETLELTTVGARRQLTKPLERAGAEPATVAVTARSRIKCVYSLHRMAEAPNLRIERPGQKHRAQNSSRSTEQQTGRSSV